MVLSAITSDLFATPMFVEPNGGLLGSPHATASPTGYSPAQVKRAYGLDNLKFNSGTVDGDGSGTTIAIVNAFDSPNIANDLRQFSQYYGLPEANFTKIDQYGGTNYPTIRNSLWITEVAIDVQWAHAIAPKANILLVEANTNSYTDLMAAVNTARNYPGVVAVSMSWGGSEFMAETTFDSIFTTPAGHTGVTFVASSGDTGAPSTYPSVSPNVVAVGGTTLQIDSNGNWVGETAWNGSGGGISIYQAQPAYQAGRVTQSSTKRTTPDVAYNANPLTGVPVYDSYNNGTVTPWSTWGGTSISAPQWAGIFAIVAQGRILAGKGSMDGATETLPALYSLPSYAFHDIITGTTTGSPNYPAGPGYDLTTGLGSPIGGFVIPQLVGQTSNSSDVRMISSTADGRTSFTITYSVDNKAVTSPLPIAVYLSSDSNFDGNAVDTLLSTVTISDPVDLSLGIHTKTFTIGSGSGQVALPGAGSADTSGDYYLLTVADPANTIAQPLDHNNVSVFAGAYHAANSGVYVQGGITADTVSAFGTSSVTLNGVTVNYTAGDATGIYIRTHEGDDTIDISLSSFTSMIYGGTGNDTIKGGTGTNTIIGGTGINTLSSGNGTNTFLISPRTGLGNDKDTIATGAGANTLSMTTFTNGVSFSLQGTTAQTADPLTGYQIDVFKARFSTILLGSGNDTVTGNATLATYIDGGLGNNTLTGGTGNDTLVGGIGNDRLVGGGGNDAFFPGFGSNTIDGTAAGSDTYNFAQRTVSGSDTDTVIANTTGANVLSFSSFTNALTFSAQTVVSQLADRLTGYRLVFSTGTFATINLGSGDDNVTGNATVGATINGGAGNNTLTGGTGNDTLIGNSGNDTLIGMGGNDSFNAGTGINILNGNAAGNSTYTLVPRTVVGSDSDTVIGNTTGTNTLSFATFTNGLTFSLQATAIQTIDTLTRYQLDVSRGVFKTVLLGSGDDTVVGNATIGTTINAGNGNNTISGGTGNDSLTGGVGNDTLNGMGGNDSFNGGIGTNILNGSGAGNSTFSFTPRTIAGSDRDTVIGNTTGSNSLLFSSFVNGLTINLQATAVQTIDALTGYQLDVSRGLYKTILLGSGSDTFTGNATVGTYISGGNGNNVLTGGSGNDNLIGGTGNDTLVGLGGNDSFTGGTGSNILDGSAAGNDTFNLTARTVRGSDLDTVIGNLTGSNTLSFTNFTNGLNVSLQSPQTQLADSITGYAINVATGLFSNILLGSGNDVVTGNATFGTTINGGSGNNTLMGGTGNDSLIGGTGNDTLIASGGTDTLNGGAGDDTYVFNTNLPLGNVTITEAVGAGNDSLDFSQTTTQGVAVDLSSSLQQIVNSNLKLTLSAVNVIENVIGGSLNDVLTGNSLNNVMTGGDGNDTIVASSGNDTLTGGLGNDTYVFNSNALLGNETIVEAVGAGTDTLDFSQTTTQSVSVDLSSTVAQVVNSNLTLTLSGGNVIENAVGGALSNLLTGNTLDNVLTGGAGIDTLAGGAGNDTLIGGAGNDTLIGGTDNDTYLFNTNSLLGTDTIVEDTGAGTDTIDFSQTTTQVISIDLSKTTSQSVNANLTLTLTSGNSIENAIGGTLANTLTGNLLDNVLTGGGANDTLNGGAGNDTVIGGAGNDTYVFNANTTVGSDTIVEGTGGGIDTLDFSQITTQAITIDLSSTAAQVVNANLTLTLSAGNVIENAIGGALANSLTGNALDNVLTGGNGNDTLTGGAGNDTLVGGNGNDTYVFNANSPLGNDTIIEATAAGTDTLDFSQTTTQAIAIDLSSTAAQVVNASLTVTLSAGNVIENAIGGALTNILVGNALDNILTGGGLNDTLTGGAGNDTLIGGVGNDTYVFNTNSALGSDTIVEAAGAGTDSLDFSQTTTQSIVVDLSSTSAQAVNANLTLTLSTGNSIENAVGGALANTLTGNSLDNVLTGGAASDILTGGAGNDTLIGGAGNDTYVFNTNSASGSDTIVEVTGAGIDTLDFSQTTTQNIVVDLSSTSAQAVNANLTLTLSAGNVIENLTGGALANSLTGNALDNVLSGGNGNDILTGGAGNDTLIGGTGNDTYVFNTNSALGSDTIVEATGAGTDLIDFSQTTTQNIVVDLSSTSAQAVNTNLTLTLSAGNVIENLTGGSLNDVLTGNSLDNVITGGNGNDTLAGAVGNDTLIGGIGNDTYVFNSNTPLGSDTIIEATTAGTDTLDFSQTTTQSVTIDLSSIAAQVVNANLTLTLSAGNVIENAIGGSVSNILTGNLLDNVLTGGIGNDTLTGGAGNDTLIGGAGNDTYIFNTDSPQGIDTVVEASGGGTDTLDFSQSTTVVGPVDLASTAPQIVNSNLTLTLSAGNVVENTIGITEVTGPVGPIMALPQINVVSATADGKTTFTLTYNINVAAVTGSFNLGIYLSGDGTFSGSDSLLSTVTISAAADLTVGTHQKTWTIGNGPNQISLPGAGVAEVAQDYYLLAVADPTASVSTVVSSNNTTVFAGSYHAPSGGIYVQGSANADTVMVFGYTGVTVNGVVTSYTQSDVSGIFVRTHDGNDSIDASGSAYLITAYGGTGNDTIKTGSASNFISGGTGINSLTVGNGTNTFLISPRNVAGSDKDTIVTGAGSNTLLMTDFTNDVSLNLQSTVSQTVNATTGYQMDVTKARLSTILLGSGNNTVVGNASIATYIAGGSGNNILTGGSGNDTLVGGVGNNTLTGSGGNDTYLLAPRTSAGSSLDTIVGNSTGINTLSFANFTNGLNINLQATAPQTADALTGYRIDVSKGLFKTILLGSGDDVVTGNASVGTTINGGSGNNTITGGTGNDTFTGGSGNDWFMGLGGNDSFTPGTGTNYMNASLYGVDVFNLSPRTGTGSDLDTIITALNGVNTLSFASFNNGLNVNLQATGPQVVDSLTGYQIDVSKAAFKTVNLGSGDDTVFGNTTLGTTINGGEGNNILIGGSGNDTLIGVGSSRNILVGGLGTDSLQGGSGDDILITGTISYSNNLSALLAIQKEWLSSDSYATRIACLRAAYTLGLNLNGLFYLTPLTITIGLTGETTLGNGGTDWFWGNLPDTTDRVTSGTSAETLN